VLWLHPELDAVREGVLGLSAPKFDPLLSFHSSSQIAKIGVVWRMQKYMSTHSLCPAIPPSSSTFTVALIPSPLVVEGPSGGEKASVGQI